MVEVALITGSSRGIGLEIAKRLAKVGYQVVLNGRREISEEVLEQFSNVPVPVAQVTGDVSNFDEAKAIVGEVIDRFGRVDILINNAGITRDGLIMRMKEADFDDVLNTNLKGAFNMCRHVTQPMLKQRAGTIINMSSVVGLIGNAGQTNYAASKAGLLGLTKALARELSSRHITVNAIAPGYIETEMTESLSDRVKETMLSQIPLKRFGQAEEIAKTVEFLIDNKYMTGQVLEVNGGLNM
ncbi:3-oxoacyl-[acyl-carrier-protein] reductase [Atopostipes suicloacalis DSM 15692]|uniref:3-oxoacyl-[acyl-carrier-protein] reductase n=1 Tax=Atopostipes suicloacalis DSM 15692 TaxID=1121025 RepID=A0A1M4UEW8_9LACT|nr:3-oxoacyl-[acyl-carrier-protein] reductase [Atopostipes suicloacalis]SHE55186.1 3-oxoacyl-[acyl-carrier-protein] reductase [Atopostipes suicloacalis DSM 15692]